MAVKYKQYYKLMVENNQETFADFRPIHDNYLKDKKKYGEQFHQVGQKVVDAIRDWDRRLCSAMGKGVFSNYSQKLSEKFWDEARKEFSAIDLVGVKSSLES
jgi:hypothetical protein